MYVSDRFLPRSRFCCSRRARFSKEGDIAGFKAIMICYCSGRGIVFMTNSDNGMALALEIMRAVERVYGWDS
jgi:hypothetical protein